MAACIIDADQDFRSPAMIEMTLPTMTCGHCVKAVTQAIEQAAPDARVSIDLPSKQVQVETTHSRSSIEAAVKEAGYEPAPAA
jgi:copper chaperone